MTVFSRKSLIEEKMEKKLYREFSETTISTVTDHHDIWKRKVEILKCEKSRLNIIWSMRQRGAGE